METIYIILFVLIFGGAWAYDTFKGIQKTNKTMGICSVCVSASKHGAYANGNYIITFKDGLVVKMEKPKCIFDYNIKNSGG